MFADSLLAEAARLVLSHCDSTGVLAEDLGNSALLLLNTIPSHFKCITSGRIVYSPELKNSSTNVSAS